MGRKHDVITLVSILILQSGFLKTNNIQFPVFTNDKVV